MVGKEPKLSPLNFLGEAESAELADQYCLRNLTVMMSKKQIFTETQSSGSKALINFRRAQTVKLDNSFSGSKEKRLKKTDSSVIYAALIYTDYRTPYESKHRLKRNSQSSLYSTCK